MERALGGCRKLNIENQKFKIGNSKLEFGI
jgi:hypothetical protein